MREFDLVQSRRRFLLTSAKITAAVGAGLLVVPSLLEALERAAPRRLLVPGFTPLRDSVTLDQWREVRFSVLARDMPRCDYAAYAFAGMTSRDPVRFAELMGTGVKPAMTAAIKALDERVTSRFKTDYRMKMQLDRLRDEVKVQVEVMAANDDGWAVSETELARFRERAPWRKGATVCLK
jgi:hypothetical protein